MADITLLEVDVHEGAFEATAYAPFANTGRGGGKTDADEEERSAGVGVETPSPDVPSLLVPIGVGLGLALLAWRLLARRSETSDDEQAEVIEVEP
jgi:hypothetical protein